MRTPRLLAAAHAAALLVAGLASLAGGRAALAETALLDRLSSLETRPDSDLWPAIEELKQLARASPAEAKTLADRLFELSGKPKLAAAAVLFARNEAAYQRAGQVALQQIARDGSEKAIRIAAIRLLRKPVRVPEAYLTLKGILDASDDLELKIEASAALWSLDNTHALRAPIVKLLDDDRPAVRRHAALALAETGYMEPPVIDVLRSFRDEPTEPGKRADLYLRLEDRARSREAEPRPAEPRTPAERAQPPREGAESPWLAFIGEVEAAVRKHSLYKDSVLDRDLFAAAARGMVSILDEYSIFQDPDDVRRIDLTRLGTSWGLGTEIVKPTNASPLVVARAHHRGTAFQAGIRSNDRILEVNGVTTHDHNRADLERVSAGAPGDEVHLLVQRWGWTAPRTFTVERGKIDVPSVRTEMLPGRIGYVQIIRFGPRSASELEAALDQLDAKGPEALVLDLRDNPGGNLKQAIQVADMFVGAESRPIVTERAPGHDTEWRATPGERPRRPMAIVVNRMSASAAEVVAGALQDFARAVVIGQRTFGKGLKQSSLPLSPAAVALLGGESRILLTTGRLYLPSGRPIQAERSKDSKAPEGVPGGIEPDIRVDDPREAFQGRQLAELLRVQYSPEVDAYIHRSYAAAQNLVEEGGTWDPAGDPGFEALYVSLKTTLSRADVRFAVRSVLHRQREDEKGIEEGADLREDRPLRRAVFEVLRKSGRDPEQVAEYRGLDDGSRAPKSGE